MKKRNFIISGILATLIMANNVYSAQVTKELNTTEKDAVIQKASSYVPKGSNLVTAVKKYNEYEVKFYNKAIKEFYKLDIDIATKNIKEFKSKKINNVGSNIIKLNKENIKSIILKEYPNAQIVSIELDVENGVKEYDVKISDAKIIGKLEINPETGIILERDIDIRNTFNNKQVKNSISVEKAKEIALKKTPNATITSIKQDFELGKYVYEIEAFKDGYEYELKIDAATGKEIYFHKDFENWFDDKCEIDNQINSNNNTGAKDFITVEKAKSIALGKVPNGKIIEIDLDSDDGRRVYEVEIIKGDKEYDIEIDAASGQILEVDVDEIDD